MPSQLERLVDLSLHIKSSCNMFEEGKNLSEQAAKRLLLYFNASK